MVLEFRIGNIFSIKDEITVDLQAANIQTKAARELMGNTFTSGDERLLKSVAIYGANASGKSNVLKAIRECVRIIRESHNYNEDSVFGIRPFKFDGYEGRPSSFYVRFLLDGVEYEYSFTLTSREILTESLYYYPNGRRSQIFSRDERRGPEKAKVYEFQNAIRRPMDVAQNTSRKTLFLSRASQMDREIPKQLFNFFCHDIVFGFSTDTRLALDEQFGAHKDELLNVLRIADSDIVDVRIVNHSLVTYHRNNAEVAFDFETEESEGTKIFFTMMLQIFDIVKHGRLLIKDEIDTSLHTKLVEYLISIFNRSDHAQLLYTSHNTRLLNMKLQRRDQVCFVNKRQDGSSDLYSVFDYKDFRDTMDLEKAYLEGKFDAIPYIATQTD